MIRPDRIDPATFTVAEAADALEVQCACSVQHKGNRTNRLIAYQRSPIAVAKRRASVTRDRARAEFWESVADALRGRRSEVKRNGS